MPPCTLDPATPRRRFSLAPPHPLRRCLRQWVSVLVRVRVRRRSHGAPRTPHTPFPTATFRGEAQSGPVPAEHPRSPALRVFVRLASRLWAADH
eukprot:scaffold10522_cov62-Phaeocystis_antarctica.AAC.2